MSFDSCIPFSCNMIFCFVIDRLKYPLVICPALRTSSASFSMRRDSRDRSHTRDRRARQSFRKHSRSRRRSHSRPQLKRSPAHQQEDSSWKSSSTHYDTQSQYGLSFPRVVESTQNGVGKLRSQDNRSMMFVSLMSCMAAYRIGPFDSSPMDASVQLRYFVLVWNPWLLPLFLKKCGTRKTMLTWSKF